MRWLFAKDARILVRSRLLIAMLIVYPAAIALLIGFALSRAPSRPRVAIVDETPAGETVSVGGRRVEVSEYARSLFSAVQPVSVASRAEAIDKVSSASVLAAVVVPADISAKVSSGTEHAHLEVIYNGDALEQSLLQAQLGSALAQANLGFSAQIQQAAAKAIDLLLRGGNLAALAGPTRLIGLREIPPLLRRVIADERAGSNRDALRRVAAFAAFAAQNLDVSKRVLSAVGQPIRVRSTLLHGRRTPLDTFAVVVAVVISEMFVCMLLAAGGIALEREEHTLARLLRGPVSRWALLSEKALLAAACALAVAFALLALVGAFVPLDWSRVALWLLALLFAAVAFGAVGVAIGALAREVRASSLLAILLSLPLAFLALVPGGALAGGLHDAIDVISFAFPFKPALQALDAAVNRSSPSLPAPLLHLAGLSACFAVLARAGLRSAD
jgi:ABC-type multidrug transport system permease subunit